MITRRSVLAASVAARLLPLARPNGVLAELPVTTKLGVVYGEVDGVELLLDLYCPPSRAEPRPAVVLLHSGAMMFGSRAELSDHAMAMAKAGYVAFNIDYRLVDAAGRNAWPAQLDDAQRAVRWVRANAATYGVDPERICAYGHSAGGNLAAQLGMRDTRDNGDPALTTFSSRVACVIDLAAETDLTIPSMVPNGDAIFVLLLGGTPEEVPDAYRDLSPITHVDAETAPFLIFHGADDEFVSVVHSRRLTDALHEAGIAVIYAEFPRAGHFVWLEWERSSLETLAFLERHR